MAAAVAVYVWGLLLIGLVALSVSALTRKGLQYRPVPVRRGVGGIMRRIAGWIVLGLGRLTIATLHLFEHLGVDMAREDTVIASWTTWSETIKADLAAALADAQTLRDTDAAEDAAQANAQSEALADKLQAAFDKVTAGPVTEEPPVTEPVDPATDPVTVPEEEAPGVPGDLPNEFPAPVDPVIPVVDPVDEPVAEEDPNQ